MLKIVNIIGGLGNQLFQYAFALVLKEKFPNENIMIDLHHFHHYPLHNGFEIDKLFNCILPVASAGDIRKVSYYIPHYKLSRLIRHLLPKRKTEYIDETFGQYKGEVFDIKGNCYYEGYWQSAKYFNESRNTILKKYSFAPFIDETNRLISKGLKSNNSVSIHIRRGDYLKNSLYINICSLDYYRNAIAKAIELLENPHFYIYSNDQNWCKLNIQPLLEGFEIEYVSNNIGSESYRDIQLMSLSKCLIIANSSFSWWAAYLNHREDKIVLAPKNWINMSGANDIQEEDWILI